VCLRIINWIVLKENYLVCVFVFFFCQRFKQIRIINVSFYPSLLPCYRVFYQTIRRNKKKGVLKVFFWFVIKISFFKLYSPFLSFLWILDMCRGDIHFRWARFENHNRGWPAKMEELKVYIFLITLFDTVNTKRLAAPVASRFHTTPRFVGTLRILEHIFEKCALLKSLRRMSVCRLFFGRYCT
jgi:hypothetical protein